MKNLKLLSFLMILASSLMFIQCSTDTLVGVNGVDGVDGVDGADGIAGIAGANGVDGADIGECVSCHSSNHRDEIYEGYDMSSHGIETTMYDGSKLSQYGNREGCAACHTNQGFIDRFNQQDIDLIGPYSTNSDQRITCTGCHSSHRSFDFVNDGNDMAMRTLEPVTLIVDDTYIFDSKNESDLMGKSNTCVNCHQPRTAGPEADATFTGKYLQTSSHWGPHHGPQSTLLEGIQGMEFASNDIAAPGTSTHRAKMSCVACHMVKEETTNVLANGEFDEVSGHSWEYADYESATCTKCHDPYIEVVGFETGMVTLAANLAAVVGQKVSNKDAAGLTVPYYPVFEADGTTPVLVTGIVIDGSPQVGLFDIKDAQAAWNYLFLLEDKSNGVHNPNYAKKLIELANQQF